MRVITILMLALFVGGFAYAQSSGPNLAGQWQGTLTAGPNKLRLALVISQAGSGGWSATLYSLDQNSQIPADSVSLQGSTLKFTVTAVRGSFEGTLSADGNSVDGNWTQVQTLPLHLDRATKDTAWVLDPSPHTVQFITVEPNVKLEVLDWGGNGRPLVLLSGLGDTAHVYDQFAPKLTPTYHVYGITRRGFGASSAPVPSGDNYSADRLGDDVLAVIDALKLDHPVLVGHSIAGEELSSIATRYPEKVAGLIYLDAGYPYAFYNSARGDIGLDTLDLKKKLDQLTSLGGGIDQDALIAELLQTSIPQFQADLKERQADLQATPIALKNLQNTATYPPAVQAILSGEQKYTKFPSIPILAIYAVPHSMAMPGLDAAALAKYVARDQITTEAQAKAFETGVPTARVVRLPNANHYVFRSNEADVLREMNAFLGTLK